eukprot:2146969-Alexandrium_andersonii.AAC.1
MVSPFQFLPAPLQQLDTVVEGPLAQQPLQGTIYTDASALYACWPLARRVGCAAVNIARNG